MPEVAQPYPLAIVFSSAKVVAIWKRHKHTHTISGNHEKKVKSNSTVSWKIDNSGDGMATLALLKKVRKLRWQRSDVLQIQIQLQLRIKRYSNRRQRFRYTVTAADTYTRTDATVCVATQQRQSMWNFRPGRQSYTPLARTLTRTHLPSSTAAFAGSHNAALPERENLKWLQQQQPQQIQKAARGRRSRS